MTSVSSSFTEQPHIKPMDTVASKLSTPVPSQASKHLGLTFIVSIILRFGLVGGIYFIKNKQRNPKKPQQKKATPNTMSSFQASSIGLFIPYLASSPFKTCS